MRKKRVLSPQPPSQPQPPGPDEAAAFMALVDTSVPEIGDESPGQPPEGPLAVSPVSPPDSPDPPARSMDDYLRNQINMERYGTETPSDYERTLFTLRRRL